MKTLLVSLKKFVEKFFRGFEYKPMEEILVKTKKETPKKTILKKEREPKRRITNNANHKSTNKDNFRRTKRTTKAL